MAYCEKCGKQGFTPADMAVNHEEKIFVGPCCMRDVDMPALRAVGPQPADSRPMAAVVEFPRNLDDVQYGLEISNRAGVKAYVAYSGLKLTFDRTPTEIKKWALENGIIESA